MSGGLGSLDSTCLFFSVRERETPTHTSPLPLECLYKALHRKHIITHKISDPRPAFAKVGRGQDKSGYISHQLCLSTTFKLSMFLADCKVHIKTLRMPVGKYYNSYNITQHFSCKIGLPQNCRHYSSIARDVSCTMGSPPSTHLKSILRQYKRYISHEFNVRDLPTVCVLSEQE